MSTEKKRPSMKEINARIDATLKQKPTQKQIDDLADVFKKINEENSHQDEQPDNRKIARPSGADLME